MTNKCSKTELVWIKTLVKYGQMVSIAMRYIINFFGFLVNECLKILSKDPE